MATLQADLELNVSNALSDIDQLGAELEAAISGAATVAIEVDASALSDVEDSIAALESDVAVGVEADTEAAVGEIESLESLEVSPIEVQVEAAGAPEATQDVEELGSASQASADSMDGLGTSTAAFGAAAGAAGGSAEGLLGLLGGLGPAGAAAGAGLAAVAGSATLLFSAAVDSVGSTDRFNQALGQFAAQVDSVELGDLNLSLEEFATMIGQDDEALRNSLTTIAAAGDAYGVAGADAARYAEQITLLAGRATVLKPSLEIGSTVDALNRSLATGGARLARYGLDIGTVSERQAIANELFGRAFEDLNRYEQSAVGAEAATRNLGSSLQRDIIAGSENVEVKLQALQQTFQNALETLGEPLILPVFDLLEAALPAGVAFAEVLGAVARAIVPLATGYLSAIGPGLEIIAQAFTELAVATEGIDLQPLFEAFGNVSVAEAELFAAAIELLAAALPLVNFDALILGLEATAAILETSPLLGLADLLGDTPKAIGAVGSEFSRLTEEERAAVQAVESFVTTAVGALPQAQQAFANVRESAENEFAGLIAAADPAALSANLEAMTAAIVTFQANLATLEQTGEDVDATLQFIASAGPQEAGSLLSNLVDGTEEDRARLETALEDLETSTTGFGDFLRDQGAAEGEGFASDVAASISGGTPVVEAAAESAGQAGAEGLGVGLALAQTQAQAAMALATAQVAASGVGLIAAAGNVGRAAGLALGGGFTSTVGTGVSVAMSIARVQIISAGVSVQNTARSSGRAVGVALGQGIASGISSQVAEISRAAADAVNQAEAAARSAAQTGSPSKVFMRVGEDMGEGMALGFAEAAAALVGEAERVTFDAANGAVQSAAGAGGGVNAPVRVNVVINGDATPETARLVRDAGKDAAAELQAQLFDVAVS